MATAARIDSNQNIELVTLLASGLLAMNLQIPIAVQQKLLTYVQLLYKWNQVYSFTAVHNIRDMIIQHILDSLAIIPYITKGSVLDFGTGVGLPGVPLALALPECVLTLLDSNHKKTAFLLHVLGMLQITNGKIVCDRVEAFHPVECFANIVTRATTTVQCVMDKVNHLCCGEGQLLVMKGKYPQQELAEVNGKGIVVYQLQVPYLNAQRHVVVVKKGLL
jgi:16S rRNA (guanine527-N7)-methyltransferase